MSKKRFDLYIIISSLLCIISCFFMFHIKFTVQNIARDIRELKNQIEIETESIRVLNAEWAYLNKPQKLKQIVVKYLPNIKPINVSQIWLKDKMKETPNNESLDGLFNELDLEEKNVNNLTKINY